MKKNIAIIFGAVLLVSLAIFTAVSAFQSPPGPPAQGGFLRDSEPGAGDPAAVNLGPNQPTDPPGFGTQIVPRFSTVNTPIITNDTGPVRVGDDLMVDGFINAKQGITTGPPANQDPTTIWGNLLIMNKPGNPAPGNLEVRGGLMVFGKVAGTLDVAAFTIIDNFLTVTKNINAFGDLAVSGKSIFYGGMEVSNGVVNGIVLKAGNVSVEQGNVTAQKIGAYYRLAKSSTWVGQNRSDVTLGCGTGDIMISCQGHAGVSLDPKMQYLGSYFTAVPTSCYASYLNTSGVDRQTWTQAVCFNPDGSAPANYVADTLIQY